MRHVFALVLLVLGLLVHAACSTPAGPIGTFQGEHDNNVTKGKTAKLTAIFEGGTAEIDHDLGAIESGGTVETAPIDADTTFTLTVTSATGVITMQTAVIKVVDAPVVTSFKADKVVRPGQTTTVTAVFTGGTGAIDGLGEVQSGKATSTGKLAATKTFTLTVTNAAADTVTADAEAEAAITPVITSFEAPGPVVSRLAPMKLTAKFTGGHGEIDNGVGPIKGESVQTPKVPMAGATYTLTVTNGLGEKVTKSVSVTTKKEMFVANYGNDILVFDADATGDVAPKRVLATGGENEGNVSILVEGGELYVANENAPSSLRVFDIAGEGPVKPKRTLSGPKTGLTNAYIFSLSGGELFVADRSAAVRVFNATDNGDVAPKRTITGAATTLVNAFGTWVDGGELYVSNNDGGGSASIDVYPVATTGNKAPTRAITIAKPEDIPTSLRVVGNELYVGSITGLVTVFNKTTKAQLRKIAGTATQLDGVFEETISDGELFCASYNANKIVVFAADANGNATPKRVLSGDTTTLAGPSGVFVY